MAGDWIRLYRSMLDHPVFQDDWMCRLFVWCLLKANYQSSRWQGEQLEPGQFITGRHRASDELGVSPSKWFRGIHALSNPPYEVLTVKSNSNWTTITVCNYTTYQYGASESEQPENSARTTSEQRADTDKEFNKGRRKEGKKNTPKPPRGLSGDYSPDFLRFWEAFPAIRKTDKAGAWKAWKSAVLGTNADVIISAAAEYAASRLGQSKFCSGPSPWLNKRRWEDDRRAWDRDDSTNIRDPRGNHAAAQAYLAMGGDNGE